MGKVKFGMNNPIKPMEEGYDKMIKGGNLMPTTKNTPASISKYVCDIGECSGVDLNRKRSQMQTGKRKLHDPDKFSNSYNGRKISPSGK